MGTARLPPLGALRCFEAAARLESFSRAADELHLTHGAVSRAVRALEDDLGIPLFERRSRRVYLTASGARLHAAVADAFAGIAAATRELRKRAATAAPLVLSCEPTLLMRWLIPRLPAFQAAHPDAALHLAAGGGAVPFAREGIDLAIRRNDFPFPDGVEAVPFMAERVGPVCAPAVAAPTHGADIADASGFLADRTLLHTRTRPDAWSRWADLSSTAVALGRGQWFEHFYFSLQAASAGLGVAIGPWALVRGEVEAGTLVAPVGFVEDGSGYYLLSPGPIEADPRASALLSWLRSQA